MPGFANVQSRCNGPPDHEWLFTDRKLLPDDETEAAYYWEFGLETADVVEEVESVRHRRALSEKVDKEAVRKWNSANPFPGVEDARLREWTNRFNKEFPDYMVTTKFHNYDAHFLFNWPEFPKQHWLEIPNRIRKRVNENRFRPVPGRPVWGEGLRSEEVMGTFGTVAGVFYIGSTGLCWQEGDPELIERIGRGLPTKYVPTVKTPWGAAWEDRWREYRMVSLSWARSDRKLKADFAEWLKENRPDDRQPYHKSKDSDSRRTTERDLLKTLGAFRLLRHFKGDWRTAADYSEPYCNDKRGNPKPLYVEQSEWRDAEKKAEKALVEFHSKIFKEKVFG